ncbi:MAG TPA: hypothetical protein VKR06_46225 [Ktedonosporobacter sp.]|nr:hypothetical protein [Ktedonosporobacter sp.]
MLADQQSAELSGWMAYLALDEEIQMNRMTYAVAKAISMMFGAQE